MTNEDTVVKTHSQVIVNLSGKHNLIFTIGFKGWTGVLLQNWAQEDSGSYNVEAEAEIRASPFFFF